MVTIRRRGGLFVASAAVCAVLLSATTVAQAETNPAGIAATSLRGGQRTLISSDKKSHHSESIKTRRLEEGGAEGEGNEAEQGEQQQEEQGEQQQEENQYGDGNNEAEQEEAADEEVQEEEQEEEVEEAEEEQQQENVEENENYDEADYGYAGEDDDQSNMMDNMQDTVADVNDKFQEYMDRFDEDVVTMWATSPADWDEEYWKVFGIVAGTFALVLSCVLYVCCMCCGSRTRDDFGRRVEVANESKGSTKRNRHRGRSFTPRTRGDNDTVGTHSTNGDYERPFVLIEDTEDEGNSKSGNGGAASSMADAGLTSPVYARESRSGSKLSTSTGMINSQRMLPGVTQTMSEADTLASFRSINANKKSRGIFDETVEVWSEFLGLTKSKYNKKELFSTDEEDAKIKTDDELSVSKKRTASITSVSPKNIVKPQPTQMKTGTYNKPKQESSAEILDPILSGGEKVSKSSSAEASIEKLIAQTPVMSNTNPTNRTISVKPHSPRRTALIKTKNLLRSFGGNSNKSRSKKQRDNISATSSDPKEEALLTTVESETV